MGDTEVATDKSRSRGRPKKGIDKEKVEKHDKTVVNNTNGGGDNDTDAKLDANEIKDSGEKIEKGAAKTENDNTRSRGRPRKAAEAANNAMKDQASSKREHDSSEEGEGTKAKKGRGRPKGSTGKTKKRAGRRAAGGAKRGRAKKKVESESEGVEEGESGADSAGD